MLFLVLAGAAACGKSDASCGAGTLRLCAWNAETQSFDRDCRLVCADQVCSQTPLAYRNGLPVPVAQQCHWDHETRTYSRACSQTSCWPDDGRPFAPWPDGGSCDSPDGLTTYFSNPPWCQRG